MPPSADLAPYDAARPGTVPDQVALREVAGVMRRHGLEEILEVPAVPATSGLRYPRAVRLDPGNEPWYLRSFGTDFQIVPVGWLRRGPRRCYSVGRDLDEAGERGGLVLAQAFTADLADAEALAGTLERELRDLAETVAVRWGHAGQLPCCWVAARIPVEDGAAHV
jgi:hypothetical protein